MTTSKHGVVGNIDTTHQTQQRDIFASGLAAKIGVHAYTVWNAIKAHADFHTGDAYPGIRRLAQITGMGDQKVQSSIKVLAAAHLLRITKKPRKVNHYIARERMDVRVGNRVICTVVVDYVPAMMRERLKKLKAAASGDLAAEDVWAQVEIIPGPGLELNAEAGTFRANIRVDEIPEQLPIHTNPTVRSSIKEIELAKMREMVGPSRSKDRRV
ncbi:MAG: hypothetical protein WAV85_17660 [Rhodoferax sp.]